MSIRWIPAFLVLTQIGCATGSFTGDPAHLYGNPDDAAHISFLRESAVQGANATWDFGVDGQRVASLAVGEAIRIPVAPGEHIISFEPPYGGLQAVHRFTAKTGVDYYFQLGRAEDRAMLIKEIPGAEGAAAISSGYRLIPVPAATADPVAGPGVSRDEGRVKFFVGECASEAEGPEVAACDVLQDYVRYDLAASSRVAAADGRADADRVVDVRLTGHRNVSTAARLAVGALAGADRVSAVVEVRDRDSSELLDSAALSAKSAFGTTQDILLEELGDQIVSFLEELGSRPPPPWMRSRPGSLDSYPRLIPSGGNSAIEPLETHRGCRVCRFGPKLALLAPRRCTRDLSQGGDQCC